MKVLSTDPQVFLKSNFFLFISKEPFDVPKISSYQESVAIFLLSNMESDVFSSLPKNLRQYLCVCDSKYSLLTYSFVKRYMWPTSANRTKTPKVNKFRPMAVKLFLVLIHGK